MLLNSVFKQSNLVINANKKFASTFTKLNQFITNKAHYTSQTNKSKLSSFSINPNRHYSSLRILSTKNNSNINNKFLLVLGNSNKLNLNNNSLIKTNSTQRTMSTTSVNFKLLQTFENIVQSNQDKRLYRGLLLDNGMKCLLISDPLTDRSAASVDVHAGYMLDPKEFPGLAHFCEHMLFMGSKKYPVENMFQKFIEDHAGSTNAYTSSENTNYHFEVATDNFKDALDIFAQFFISPLFDSSSTDREINAVDSENQKNLQSDAWRIDQLEKSTCRPDHPYSKFGTGNLDTLKTQPEKLGLNVREALLKYHSNYYSANLMTLCLLGKESLDDLQKYAVDMFSDIPNKNLNKTKFEPDPFGADTLSTVKYVVPVQDLRQLSITWTIPDLRDAYESNPAQYISHLVGHEGDGSLLSELKRKGWCNHLYAGSRRESMGFQFFNITVDLSEEGGENIDNIIKLVYQYMNMLRQEKPVKWVFDEMNNLGKISFTFKDKEKPISFVSSLSSDLHVYSMEHILTANYYLTKYDSESIDFLFDYLTPDKMRVTVVSKKYDGSTDKKEKWYGTDYKEENLSDEKLNELKASGLNSAFSIPPLNTFIPTDLNLVKHDSQDLPNLPRIIHFSPLTRLWFKEDTKFLLPKAVLKFEIRNPLVYFDPVHTNMSNMFIELLRDSLAEYLYPAELAGLRYMINPTNYGITVTLSGFSDKLNVLLETIFEKMSSFKIDPQRFNILKESYQRSLVNFEAEQPYKHAVYYMTLMISEKGWTKKQLSDSLNDFTIDDLQSFIPKLLTKGVFIESIMFGNLTQSRALEFLEIAENKLKNTNLIKCDRLRPLEKLYVNNLRQINLPDGANFVYLKNNNIHKTVGIETYYQCNIQNTHNNALVELFCQVINESCFNILRTQEQLGYIVASGVRNFGGAQGVRIIVQSDRNPVYLDERIENFINITEECLEKMTDDEFKMHVDALALTKLETPKKMSRQCDIYWNEINSHQYNFDRENIEVEELRKLTKDELLEFFRTFISSKSNKRRKLAVYINPSDMNPELNGNLKANLVEDLNEWRASLPLYPLPKPFVKLN